MTSAYFNIFGGLRLIATAIAGGALLSSCASYQPRSLQVGMDRTAVQQSMGLPETERKQDAGLRLEYPGGPYGIQTWFVDLDASSRVTGIAQVLTEDNFAKVRPDMAQSDLRALLGRPGEVQVLGRDRGVVWSYRYENMKCQWFQAEISAEQTVRSAGMGTPPECMGSDDRYVP